MKSQEPQEKKFRQLSDEELEKVNGGARGVGFAGCNVKICNPGEKFDATPGICQCVPVPNTGVALPFCTKVPISTEN